MAKRKSWIEKNILLLIITILLVGGFGWFIYFAETGGLKGMFNLNNTYLPPDDSDKLEQTPTGECSISFDKSTVCVGDLVTGTLKNGKNALCRIAFKYNYGDWLLYGDVNTNSDGEITISDSPDTGGTYLFASICFDDNGVCRTNDAIVNVEECSDCTDSDGGEDKYTPGHVIVDGLSYYDHCIFTDYDILEHSCVDGELVSTYLLCDYGQECIETRSGGYCRDTEDDYENGVVVGSHEREDYISSSVPFTTYLRPDFPETIEGGGGCKLQARISTNWEYANEYCQGLQGNEGVTWKFHDSDRLVYQRTDSNPIGLGVVTECGLSWHDDILWRLEISKPLGLPNCQISVDYKIEAVTCDC